MARIEPVAPLRPALPLTSFLFLGMWISTATTLNYFLDRRCGVENIGVIAQGHWLLEFGIVLLLIVTVVSILGRSTARTIALMFMVGLMCGVFLGSMAHRMQSLRMATLATHDASPVTVRAVEVAYTSAYGTSQIVKVIEGSMRGMRIQFSYSEGVAPLERGQSAFLSDMILPLARTEKSRTLYAKDIIGRAQVSSLDEYHYRGWMSPLYRYRALLAEQNIAIGQYSAITRGVLLGDRRGISDQLNDDLAQAGIRHFLTVSGTHIAVMSAGLIRLLSHTAFTRRQVQCIVLGAATVYVILVGYP
ncbi:MAG: ComEC/Rec2 family competence protein, partial [Actinomycetia bacterium]|nr:ComEC/Rec2 family competence protein [Actinomycetes bacterium]